MFCEMLSKDLFEYYRSCNKLDEIAQQLQEAVTDEDRVAIAFIHLERINAIPIDDGEKNPTKNTEESIKIRNFGNQAFRKSNSSREALLLYTQSIASARYRSEELALGHSNRSAVLFRRCAYDACLKDIEQAIASRYPEHLKHKLLERREKCLSRQSGGQACQDSVKSADGESGEMADGDLVQAPWSDDVQSCDPRDMETRAYTVKSNIDYGRYLIATRDIKPGDIVDFEKPYASIVWPEFVYTHCSNCLMRCDNLIPCKHCSLAMFCCAECRTDAWSKFHRIECPVMLPAHDQHSQTMKDSLLALRLLVTACNANGGLRGHYMTLQQEHGGSVEHRAVHGLLRNTEKRSLKELYRMSITAACIVNCLDVYADFFSTECDLEKLNLTEPNWKHFAGGLLLKYLEIISCNSFAIMDTVFTNRTGIEGEICEPTVQFGAGIYPRGSMINHSCDPNIFLGFQQGDTLVTMATRYINEDTQLFSSYGPSFTTAGFPERQSVLKSKYFFQCYCAACTNNWPAFSDMTLKRPRYVCPNCQCLLSDLSGTFSVVCRHCHQSADLRLQAKKLDDILQILVNIKSQLYNTRIPLNFLRELSECLLELDKCVQRPSGILFYAEQSLKLSLGQTGNYYVE